MGNQYRNILSKKPRRDSGIKTFGNMQAVRHACDIPFNGVMAMPHVLIVDDDVETLQALEKVVRLEGFTSDAAQSLQEARASMVRRRADVVLLDLNLPDGEGMDLFDDVELRKGTQIVLITGNASLETSIQALRLGATDYLIKPVNVKQLKNILSRIDKPLDLKYVFQ